MIIAFIFVTYMYVPMLLIQCSYFANTYEYFRELKDRNSTHFRVVLHVLEGLLSNE
jgi:hypothetical protein